MRVGQARPQEVLRVEFGKQGYQERQINPGDFRYPVPGLDGDGTGMPDADV